MTPDSLTIRPAQPADGPSLGRLGALLVALHHDFDADRFMASSPQTADGYAGFLVGQLQKPDILVLVADRGGRVVGYAYAGVEGTDYMALRGPAGVVYDLVVDPGCRREGVGRRLLDATLAALAGRGVPRVVLSTADRNTAAQALFAGSGFRRTMIEMTWEAPEQP